MRQIGWLRFVNTLITLDCKTLGDHEHFVVLAYKATYVLRVLKISPVTIKRQEVALQTVHIDRAAYLVALAGTGPPIADDK